MMQFVYYLIAFLIVVLVVIPILKKMRIKNLRLWQFFQVEFLPDIEKEYHVQTLDNVGIVVSTDAKTYKLHSEMTLKCPTDSSFNNAQLFISGLGWFVYRQSFTIHESGGHIPDPNTDRTLLSGRVYDLKIEFEPKDGWKPFEIREGTYKSMVVLRLLGKRIKHRFVFVVRPQNIQAIKQHKAGSVLLVKVPIVEK